MRVANRIIQNEEHIKLNASEIVYEDKGKSMTVGEGKANKQQEDWQRPVLENGWKEVYTTRYRKDEFGNLQIKGLIEAGLKERNTTLFQLPEGYRPNSQRRFIVYAYSPNEEVAMLNISLAGNVMLFRMTGMEFTYISLDNISIPLN